MDSLTLPSSSSHIISRFLRSKSEIRGIKQVSFVHFWRQRSKPRAFSLRCHSSFSDPNEGGGSSSTSGDVPVNGEQQQQQNHHRHHYDDNQPQQQQQQQQQQPPPQSGQLIGPVRDNSGSIVAFRVFSQPQSDESELLNLRVNGTSGKQEEKEVQEEEVGTEEQQTNEIFFGEGDKLFTEAMHSTIFQEGLVHEESVADENIPNLEGEIDIEGHSKTSTKVTRNIVFVTSEVAPYSKTGGLGDVCGSLPISLAARGHRVMVISPRYIHGTSQDQRYAGAFDVNCRIKVFCFGGEQEVAFFHEFRAGVDWVFVDHPAYHRPGNPYGDSFGAFGDNQFRFTLLCHAACEAPLVLPLGGYTYGDKCLFLVNDWHAGLVSVLLAAKYRPFGVYKDARSILVIHNLSHQGVEPALTYNNLGLPPQWYGALEWVFPEWARAHELDKGEAVNILKGAIVTSDRILTVSQGYSWEITTVEGGYGLHELLTSRQFVLNGIVNGIDISEWDPSSDEHIAAHYSVDDLSGKAECKAALQKELGLPLRPDCPLIGFIGRLDYQKGIDLIQAAIPELMRDDVQFVMLGSGDPRYEQWMKATEATYRDKFRGWVGFNVPISHRITAGCDILLMPSRFEPCGLNQLYAMRYGTIPVVHATGGLRDTVETYNPYAVGPDGNGSGTGWAFSPLTKESMLSGLWNAIITYRQYKTSWEELMKRGMGRDFTWESAAAHYEQVFEWAFIDPPYC